MEQALSIGKKLLDTIDTATGFFPKVSLDSMIMLIALIVIGAFVGILGLKLIRLFAGLAGLVSGAVIGMIISNVVGLSSITEIIVVIICAVVLAAVCAYFARLGTFFLIFIYGMVLCTHVLDWEKSNLFMLLCLAVPFLIALISAILYEPAVILISGVTGGIMIGFAVVTFGSKADVLWMLLGMCAGFSVICMMIQILINRGSRSERSDDDDEFEAMEKKPRSKSKKGVVVDEDDDDEIMNVNLDDIDDEE